MELTLLSAKLSAHLWTLLIKNSQEPNSSRPLESSHPIIRDDSRVRSVCTQDMKTCFWLSEDPIGEDIICPRDGRPGCALVDWIPRRERREQTHFMSWTWKYSLQQVKVGISWEC